MRIKHIDGIRAISVLSVVCFHAFPEQFPNGFVGVDYFLVISGFLISKKYFFLNKSFSFSNFWEKRILRIYPQLLVCILICVPISFFTMQPDYLENFSQSVIASLLGLNNFLLFLTGGYWSLANEMKPLFNTWSLGLEEQFYLLISIIFYFVESFRFKRYAKYIFLIGSVISFIFCSVGFIYFQEANYLLLPTRFWEFSIGILAAYILVKFKNRISKLPLCLTNISFLIIILTLIFPIDNLKFSPNPLMIFPLVSIGIICIESRTTFAIKFLSLPLITYIGVSSYSIYLYHQPIFAFSRISNLNELSIKTNLFLTFLSLFIGILMFEVVENKNKNLKFTFHLIKYLESLKSLFFTSLFLITSNIPIVAFNGLFELRFPELMIEGKPPEGFLGGKGYTDYPYIFKNKRFSSNNNSIKIFVYGNSQARDLINALIELAEIKKFKFDFSYTYSEEKKIANLNDTNILNNADLIIIQTDMNIIPKLLLKHKKKIIALTGRERFVYNVNPILFKSTYERSNLVIENNDTKICSINDPFELTNSKNNEFSARINTQCAFNDQDNRKILTSKNGEIFTFDGVHLSKSGARKLANELILSKSFLEYINNISRN